MGRMRDECEIMCSHSKAMGSQYTRKEQNQFRLKCIVLRQIYGMGTGQNTAVIPQLIKTIKENENMTVSYNNKLSLHHK